MVIKIGVNGFGRIGRITSRACLKNPNLQLAAINDPAISVEYVSYLIRFDSTHGKLNGIITYGDDELVIDGHHIKVFHEKVPPRVPWHSAGVQYVVEASGMFTSYEKASGHLSSSGVKRVIVTAPSTDIPMIILGVNDCNLSPEQKIVSCASSTLYCLAPIVKVLDDNFGVEEGFITSIHAMTPSLKPLDGLCLRGRHWRDHRSIHQNIIPATTGACKALGKILPQVKDKLTGLAFRVPIANVSVLDLTIRLRSMTTLQEIVRHVKQASKTTLKNIIKVSSEETVSSDFNGETSSCIFDEFSSLQLKPNFFKLVCWYENEYSYACRVVDTILFSEKQFITLEQMSVKQKMTQEIECLKKEICNACNCKLGPYPKIVSNVFKNTEVKTRSPYALFVQTQPPIANSTLKLHKHTKTNGLLKTRKANEASSNRCPYLQSFAQPSKNIEFHTQAHLENVKKEFTKMVSITEELLKKANSNQSNVQSISGDAMKCLNEVKSKDIYREKSGSSAECYNAVEECGDRKSLALSSSTNQTLNDYCIDKDEGSLAFYEKDKSECSVSNSNITKDSRSSGDITCTEKDFCGSDENKGLPKISNKKCEETLNPNREFEPQTPKSTPNFMNRSSQNIQVTCVWNNKENKTDAGVDKDKKAKETCKTENSVISKLDCSHLVFEKKKREITNFENEQDAYVNTFIMNKFMSITENSNIKVIDNELRKRNIVLVDSPFALDKTENGLRDEDNYNSVAEIDETFLGPHLPEHKLEGFTFTPQTVMTVSEETKCTTPFNNVTVINNAFYENRQDIYDKLDSASESTSNNSFEINVRKSQVIQITDLTNSLEDLARLDKICRIIEISDELSDKLFSALDINHSHEPKKKKWSFKDLCAKIKLDEFCNAVFGGNAVAFE